MGPLCATPCSQSFACIPSVNPHSSTWGGDNDHLHFMEKERDTEELSNLPTVTQLLSGEQGFQPRQPRLSTVAGCLFVLCTFIQSSQLPCEGGITITPILQGGKLRLREAMGLPSPTAIMWEPPCVS